MIEVGCQTYSLRGLRGRDLLESVRKAGFRAVELWCGQADYAEGPAAAARVRRAADEVGIAIRAYSVGGFVHEGVAIVERQLAGAFAYAEALGVDLVTGVIDRRAVPTVDTLCRRTGLRFAIENHWYADFAAADDYVTGLRGVSPLIGVALDTGHVVAAGGDPEAAFTRLAGRVFDIHLKDVVVAGRLQRWLLRRPRMEGRTIGGGASRLDALLAALVRGGYEGFLAVEDERPELPLSELHASLRACTAFIRAARTNGLVATDGAARPAS